jgi:hypothetical protein
VSYTNTHVPIIIHCLGLFVVVFSKQHCLWTKKYYVTHVVIDMYIPTNFMVLSVSVFELCWFKKKKKKKEMNKTTYYSPIHVETGSICLHKSLAKVYMPISSYTYTQRLYTCPLFSTRALIPPGSTEMCTAIKRSFSFFLQVPTFDLSALPCRHWTTPFPANSATRA